MNKKLLPAFLIGTAFVSVTAQTVAPPPVELVSSSALPDAPSAVLQAAGQTGGTVVAEPENSKQTKRILGVIPNFRSVSSQTILPPETAKEKLTTTLKDTFDYSAAILVGVQTGIAFANKSNPEFHQGAAGFGRYYWHTYADYANENLWVEAILPIALKQDNRYYTKGHGGIPLRAAYALTRAIVTRSDSGHETFNTSEVLGAGTASAVSTLYYPAQERTWTKVGQRWLTNVLIDGGTFVAKEFWPDLNASIFHQKD